jgi:hypothetical protein
VLGDPHRQRTIADRPVQRLEVIPHDLVQRRRLRPMALIDTGRLESEGYTPEQMQDVFAVPLTLAQIHLALAYAAAHPEDIEAAFAAGDEALQQIERDRADFLKRRSGR